MLVNILYLSSGIIWAVEMLPQLMKIYKRKSVADISIYFPMLALVSFALYLTASFLVKNWILIYTNIAPLICNIIFFLQVLIYRRKK